MRYRIRHTTKYAYSDPVAVCHNLVRLVPRATATQTVHDYRLSVTPEPADRVDRLDLFGNRVEYFSIHHSHKGLTLLSASEVEVDPAEPSVESAATWEEVRESLRRRDSPADASAYRFVFPSTHAPHSAALRDYSADSFPVGRQLRAAVLDLTARIHADFDYDPSATTVSTPVREAFERRAGVCQDFAHLQVAMLRSLGLAARYVSGYLRTTPPPGKQRLVGADASHAWLAVYAGREAWIDLDPTNDCVPGEDHITIGWGRDYADVAPVQGVFVGGGAHALSVSVDVEPLPVAGAESMKQPGNNR